MYFGSAFSVWIYGSMEKYTDQTKHELEKRRLTTQILLFCKVLYYGIFGGTICSEWNLGHAGGKGNITFSVGPGFYPICTVFQYRMINIMS